MESGELPIGKEEIITIRKGISMQFRMAASENPVFCRERGRLARIFQEDAGEAARVPKVFGDCGRIIMATAFAAILFFSLNVFAENEFLKSVPDEVDLGTIEEGSPAAVTVTVQNTGDAPVEITNVRTN